MKKRQGMRSIRYRLSVGVGGAALMAMALFNPVTQAATSNIYIAVTVVNKPACTVNNNQTIDVNFGDDLFTVRVDGNNYIKTLDYTLECRDNTKNAMKMKVVGVATAFDGSALQTNKADLGVALRAEGHPLPINSWLNFTYPAKPLLQAVPIKRAGSTLTAGAFSAGATLMVDYQ
ncbi:fimbrial protein [Serratia entomophila]|uniref:fimbrial protein n=1 Tax=Serratia entomophila TaxID=42906 RepID=UPI00217ACB3A|nr:fimbrial protein [Serratia entomophila]CAI0927909.1 putative minor fimbrial subunit StfF [Serratia entomophila]CAI1541135.1 putative minor fimbrial subunit StfF [Serratia entomophila]CAI1662988.1 putative minor fimbrial subunit StfF [Serratia entomophila]CAI1744482.1 putative minor fimbrial subunit StfF [Serratia entomophila]CAI1775270.1 putative minor fimbrial subunit StfF [Serratia entomophila]